ncbi:hypothetical protein QRX60_16305 [Amycolatopsis mongoliensis]|uniref:Uncharacterized protein n=1 Tax=Amycolatopsis mongoliensis TaxID=715475 RepID=A0A9Y2NP97_9PSEU|nr:hypothetical protein [Amycolatopsis sp. 4-36]WIY05325.1 hypothetical protein QRX60_16305 [Amycolatopsis sp. 4-36]
MNTRGMPKDHTVLLAVSLTAAFMLVGGLGWFLTRDSPQEAPRALPSVWPTAHGEALRPVPMPTGELAAALPFSSRGHVLCEAVPEQTWSQVLGGPVLREVTAASCHVVTPELDVTANTAEPAPVTGVEPAGVAVAGHQGTMTSSSGYDATLIVRLADTGEQWRHRSSGSGSRARRASAPSVTSGGWRRGSAP